MQFQASVILFNTRVPQHIRQEHAPVSASHSLITRQFLPELGDGEVAWAEHDAHGRASAPL